MHIGLFFGSFNPIHSGHLMIANYLVEHSDLEELWLVLTPHNPHKKRASLANDFDRLHLVTVAAQQHPKIKPCDIEFNLPKPSYTIDTLAYLREEHPDKDFTLIIGGDNLATFHKWKNYDIILRDFHLLVYKRPHYDLGELQNHEKVQVVEAPIMEISSSFIRQLIKEGKSIAYWVPETVKKEIDLSGMYAI